MQHDAVIIGGSFAGLTAATYLARGRRSVAIIDAGLPRNRFAAHSHGVLTRDGSSPTNMLKAARSQVAAYPTVTFVPGEAATAEGSKDAFNVTLADGTRLEGRRLVLAFGISDILPDLPGVAERWGQSVIHCPYCHGYEFSGQQLGVLAMHAMSTHQARLVAQWGPTIFFGNGMDMDSGTVDELAQSGVTIESTPMVALHGPGKALDAVELADGRRVPLAALYLGAPIRLNSPIAAALGCTMENGPLGAFIATDAMKMTSVPGVYAAGDITRAMHNVTFALADGVMAGTSAHASLVF